jgi:tetratricopeptide (TPR) repeat protein
VPTGPVVEVLDPNDAVELVEAEAFFPAEPMDLMDAVDEAEDARAGSSVKPESAVMPESVKPVISSPPPPRRRRRLWLIAAAMLLLGAGGIALWTGPELQRMLTGGTAAANQSIADSTEAAPPTEPPKPKSDTDAAKGPPREQPSGPLADAVHPAPTLDEVRADRGLLPGLQQASEMQLLAMADAADRKQDFDTALHFVANAVERFPDSPRTRETHVRVLLHHGDASAALRQADEYLKQENDRELVLLRGDAQASLGRLDDAVETWTQGLDKSGLARLSGLALNQGRDQARRAHVAETKRKMRRASLLMPDNLEAATGVVEMLLRQDEAKPAVEWARRVVEKAPTAGFSHALLGRALLAAGRREEAVAALERSVQLNPGDKPTVSLLIKLRGN